MKSRLPLIVLVLALASCAHRDRETLVRVSVPNQKLMVFKSGIQVAMYDCSTSKYGVGDAPGSFRTPLGRMIVAQKIGDRLPSGMKLQNRRPTGEIVKPNAPGRDPIVSRILWLRGTEKQNAHAFNRAIYIHGTAEECMIGTPASYGCIRMRSRDVIKLYDMVGVGATVEVLPHPFPAPLLRENNNATPPAAQQGPVASPSNRAANESTQRS
ncbi:MAG TPA: L,D-transpeptidase family protein [Chthoniobacteraceae bacterium]|nr:L,D-transpeptidase family protein [Chthoniobacteraceae bacterium]